jgi:hypothetical protein
MANMFEETTKILDGPDKDKFRKMNENVNMKFIKHLEQMREQDSDSFTEEEEEEQPQDAVIQEKRNDTKDQRDEEDQLSESYYKYIDQKCYSIIETPVHWLNYPHNQWRSMELMEEGCAIILEAIQNNKIHKEMNYG